VKTYNAHSNAGLEAAHSETGQGALVASEQVSRSFVAIEGGRPIHYPAGSQPEWRDYKQTPVLNTIQPFILQQEILGYI
jgi:hypothetical protein